MAGSDVALYAAELRGHLGPLGVATPELDELVGAGHALATAVDATPETLSEQARQEVASRGPPRLPSADDVPAVVTGPLSGLRRSG